EEQSIHHTESSGSAARALSATMRAMMLLPEPGPPARCAAPCLERRSSTVCTPRRAWTRAGRGCFHRFENGPLRSGGEGSEAAGEEAVRIEMERALVSLLPGRFASVVICAAYCPNAAWQNPRRSTSPQSTDESRS